MKLDFKFIEFLVALSGLRKWYRSGRRRSAGARRSRSRVRPQGVLGFDYVVVPARPPACFRSDGLRGRRSNVRRCHRWHWFAIGLISGRVGTFVALVAALPAGGFVSGPISETTARPLEPRDHLGYDRHMADGQGSRSSSRTQAPDVPTAEKIVELLRAAVPGAEELDDKLKRVFRLSEAQASLRLK